MPITILELFFKRRKYKRSHKLYKSLQLGPNFTSAHNNLGTALKEKGDITAAINSYNTALKLEPSNPDIHNNLGAALKEKGDLLAATTSYKTALKIEPNNPEIHNNLGAT